MSEPIRAPPATSNRRQCPTNTSRTGASTLASFASIDLNTGVSSTPRRSQNPSITNRTLDRNGIRQPHSWNVSGVMTKVIKAMNPAPNRVPQAGPTCVKEAFRPRWRSSPCSMDNSTDPAHSPPIAAPCRKRSRTRRIGLQIPQVS
ncbi:hypothetical protein D3C80_1574670 [compost metagenome]